MLVIPADEMEGGSSGGGGLATAGAEGETAVSGEGGGVGPEAAGSGGNAAAASASAPTAAAPGAAGAGAEKKDAFGDLGLKAEEMADILHEMIEKEESQDATEANLQTTPAGLGGQRPGGGELVKTEADGGIKQESPAPQQQQAVPNSSPVGAPGVAVSGAPQQLLQPQGQQAPAAVLAGQSQQQPVFAAQPGMGQHPQQQQQQQLPMMHQQPDVQQVRRFSLIILLSETRFFCPKMSPETTFIMFRSFDIF